MSDIRPWLSEWLSNRNLNVDLAADDNFFDKGALDSFGVIELIEDIEDKFDIIFDETDFQDRRFPTIGGLSELIAEKSQDA